MTLASITPSHSVPETLADALALLAQREQQLHVLELKNQKLTHELAYLKRLRFSQKSEAMSA